MAIEIEYRQETLVQIQPSWLECFKKDVERYQKLSPGQPLLKILLLNQGIWALLQYRLASSVYHSASPGYVKQPLLVVAVIGQKLIELTCGICLPYAATIGPGLYIAHFGGIIIHPESIVGPNCNISQGVTIGIAGRGIRRGAPIIGERVFIGPNATVLGKITVGSRVAIGANSLVNRDVVGHTTVLGVPAQIINNLGSDDYVIV